MTNSFDTDLQIFENTLRKELPGRVIRVKGNHIDDPSERQRSRAKNKELLQALGFNFNNDDKDLAATDVCSVQGTYENPDTGDFCLFNMQIDYCDDPNHNPHGFALPHIAVAVDGPSMFNEDNLKRYDKDLADDFKAHWAETNGHTDAAEAARLCVKHIAHRAENK